MSAPLNEDEKLLLEAQRALELQDNVRALTAADELLMRDPENDAALFIAGTALLRGDQKGIAVQLLNACRAVTKDKRKQGVIWNNIGYCLQDYHPERAYLAVKKAIECGYDELSYDNMCNLASTLGRHAEALEWAEKAAERGDPSYNRAFALLMLGRWAEAWADYDKSAGKPCRPITDRDYGLPRWDGKKEGKVILHGEQGVGDEIMFMSMCPADFDGVIDCNPRNASLFRRAFPNATVYGTLLQGMLEWPLNERADYHLEMGGLGSLYGREAFRRGGYLTPDPARKAAMEAWIGAMAPHIPAQVRPLRVGISWTGGTWETGRKKRSIPFDLIRRYFLAQHRDVTWVNLEYDPRDDELERSPVPVLNPYWATRKGAEMDDLAALCASLDLVISATNSTVDICGALGVPVWALVNVQPQWRYSEAAGEDHMWFYDSARTFRQREDDAGKWDRVCANAAMALAKLKVERRAPKMGNGKHEPANDGWVSC